MRACLVILDRGYDLEFLEGVKGSEEMLWVDIVEVEALNEAMVSS